MYLKKPMEIEDKSMKIIEAELGEHGISPLELKVVESTVTARADTITAQNKSVVMETGLTMGVPVFIKEGDVIKIDTRTGVYVERITGKK